MIKSTSNDLDCLRQEIIDNILANPRNIWNIVLPRRYGKTRLLKQLAAQLKGRTIRVVTTNKQHTAWGTPFDVDEELPPNSVLLVDEYNLISGSEEIMSKAYYRNMLVVATSTTFAVDLPALDRWTHPVVYTLRFLRDGVDDYINVTLPQRAANCRAAVVTFQLCARHGAFGQIDKHNLLEIAKRVWQSRRSPIWLPLV